LGPDAKSAMPDLVQLLNQEGENRKGLVEYTLPVLGLDGIPPLTNRLAMLRANGQDPASVIEALGSYANSMSHFAQAKPRTPREIESAAEMIVPILVPCLNDPHPQVPGVTARILGEFRCEPDLVVPAIVELLQKNKKRPLPFGDTYLSTLRVFGPRAKAAVPVLLQLARDPDRNLAGRAAEALKFIDPQAADKAGID
jgi:hypothetical protein